MLSPRFTIARAGRDEAEKPFWISFSDLMTAMMVLFLVVMMVSLLSVTTQLRDSQTEETERNAAIARILDSLQAVNRDDPAVHIDRARMTVDFGELARFAVNEYRLSPGGAEHLRAFVPRLLRVTDSDDGRRWFRRVVVEGFTDPDGSYLHNLHLSLSRAESVVCALLDSQPAGGLSAEQRRQVRKLFLVGGVSSNSARDSKKESRRVELRLDFRATAARSGGEPSSGAPQMPGEDGQCRG